jgi:hypothetical protein
MHRDTWYHHCHHTTTIRAPDSRWWPERSSLAYGCVTAQFSRAVVVVVLVACLALNCWCHPTSHRWVVPNHRLLWDLLNIVCRSQWPRCLRRTSAVAGVAGSNSARGMDVCLLCLYVVLSCVGRGLCEGLIIRPEESYRMSNCVLSKNPEKGGQRSILDYKRLWRNEWIQHCIPYNANIHVQGLRLRECSGPTKNVLPSHYALIITSIIVTV